MIQPTWLARHVELDELAPLERLGARDQRLTLAEAWSAQYRASAKALARHEAHELGDDAKQSDEGGDVCVCESAAPLRVTRAAHRLYT
jgi:hypothetical protein